MKIKDILAEMDVISSYIPDEMRRRRILSLCHNSQYATPTCAFFCKVGSYTDGHIFARNAYLNGARIFIAEHELDLPCDAAVIITPNATNALNRIAVMFYDDPAKKLKIIGITGTKGKTTVAISSYKIALLNGIKAGYIGTNGIYYNGKVFETANTTPDALELQKALWEMVNDGVTTVMLEVSSQALWQERTYGLEFDTCVFTNLYSDHIGKYEHPTFEHYRDSKKRLFTDYSIKNIIINSDCDYSQYMIEGAENANIISISASGNSDCNLYAENAVKRKNGVIPGIAFKLCLNDNRLTYKKRPYDVFMSAPGIYSVENGLLIISVCLLIGIKLDDIVKQLTDLSVPGRFEAVTLKSKPNSLFIIDYAHNGASLKAVIDALREYSPKRLICLFGSVGGRTYGRRAELGRAAVENADIIIITSDNPNAESPQKIIDEIREAVGDTDKPVYTITDRAEAVRKAYELAEDGDYILLAGKGHENYQLLYGERVPFSERNILELADLSLCY